MQQPRNRPSTSLESHEAKEALGLHRNRAGIFNHIGFSVLILGLVSSGLYFSKNSFMPKKPKIEAQVESPVRSPASVQHVEVFKKNSEPVAAPQIDSYAIQDNLLEAKMMKAINDQAEASTKPVYNFMPINYTIDQEHAEQIGSMRAHLVKCPVAGHDAHMFYNAPPSMATDEQIHAAVALEPLPDHGIAARDYLLSSPYKVTVALYQSGFVITDLKGKVLQISAKDKGIIYAAK